MVLKHLLAIKMKTLHYVLIFIILFSVVYIFAFSSFFEKLDTEQKVIPPEGLKIRGRNFTLRKKPFRIMSGSLHYFRIPFREWDDRLIKLKAMGLNTVDIYIPWNLHEPSPGVYNFDNEEIMLTSFLNLVTSYELYAIVRPGPYICSEWDLGGLPSWLLRDKNMTLRSMYPGYIKAVDRYFDELLPLLKPFQFSYGGPIIAFQIENEYGSYGTDEKYMNHLRNVLEQHYITELLFVCDNEEGLGKYKLDDTLQTVNFMSKNAKKVVEKLLVIQPNKPIFVTELWDGWFDHWGEKHHTVDVEETIKTLSYIIHEGGSFNLYMWHGGTTFGFMNGANANNDGSNYQSDITSYDYDAPLSETGDEGKKFAKLQEFFGSVFSDVFPKDISSYSHGFSNYGDIELKKYLSLENILRHIKPVKQEKVTSMEMLKDHTQLYGYIVYQIKIKNGGKVLKIERAKDFAVVVLNKDIIYTSSLNEELITVQLDLKSDRDDVLQIIVENCGRVNYGMDIDNQRKGILGAVSLDDKKLLNWEIYSLEFRSDWLKTLSDDESKWSDFDSKKSAGETKVPSMYKGILYVHHFPRRTFISLPDWFKGVVFVNGFNLGRYWNIGPQKTLYVPAQLLRMKNNDLILFDLHGTTKIYGEKEYPMAYSTNERDIGQENATSFLI